MSTSLDAMTREENDWRLNGQEKFLRGAELSWKRYHARDDTWEHEHCAFCRAKFMDPDFSKAHRRQVDEHRDALTQGYATTAKHQRGVDGPWVCEQYFEDFADLFAWRVVQAG